MGCWAPRLAMACVLVSGCRAFDEGLLSKAGPTDAGAACELALPPPRPTVPDTGDPAAEIVFALRAPVFDQRDGWETVGYDLDGLCTTEDDPRVECVPPSASAPPEIDGAGGIDNVVGHQLLMFVLLVEPGLAEELAMATDQGIGAPVLRLRGWNGEADDPRVDAILMQSAFGSPQLPDEPVVEVDVSGIDEQLINGEVWPLPAWAGADYWWLRSESFIDGDITQPRVRDDNAYVADRTLVMRLPDRFPLVFGSDTRAFVFSLTDVTFTVRFASDGMSVEEAMLSGRFPALDLLDTLQAALVCPGSDEYMQIERLLELASDIRATPGTGGPGVACDAVSVGLVWRGGVRANIVDLWEWPGLPEQCRYAPDGGVPDAGGISDAGIADGGAPSDGGGLDAGSMDGG